MDLQQFIAQSLVQIMGGVKDAQGQIGKSDAEVCPVFLRFTDLGEKKSFVGISQKTSGIAVVEFDVAVEATSETAGGGAIKVIGGFLGGEIGGKAKDVDKVVSRIRFSVPVAYPPNPH